MRRERRRWVWAVGGNRAVVLAGAGFGVARLGGCGGSGGSRSCMGRFRASKSRGSVDAAGAAAVGVGGRRWVWAVAVTARWCRWGAGCRGGPTLAAGLGPLGAGAVVAGLCSAVGAAVFDL